MKKISTLVLLLFIFTTNTFAKCTGHSWIWTYSNGILESSYSNFNPQSVTAFFNPGDSIVVRVQGETMCGSNVLLLNNGDTLLSGLMSSNNVYITLADSGHYFMHYVSSTSDWTWEFSLNYFVNTGLQTVGDLAPFQIYPSETPGIYRLKSGQTLKHLMVFDQSGKIIIETNAFSEIDIRKFSNGVYFYAITDENEKVWQGKLIKN